MPVFSISTILIGRSLWVGSLVKPHLFALGFDSGLYRGEVDLSTEDGVDSIFRLLELPGGYIGVNGLSAGVGWQQLTDQPERAAQQRVRPRVGSRRERRRTTHSNWKPSTAHESLPEVPASARPLRRRP